MAQTRRKIVQSALAIATIALSAKTANAAAMASGKTWCVSRRPHFDRVMSAWAIKRFVDKDAKFVFAATIEESPKDATPVGFKTGEFSMHDDRGTCFHKVTTKFELLRDPAIAVLDRMCTQGIQWFLHGKPVDMNDRYARWAMGILGVADSMSGDAVRHNRTDQELLDRSFPMYDVLYDQITFELKKGTGQKNGH